MEPDASTASAAATTASYPATTPPHALTTPLPRLSLSSLNQTQRRYPQKFLFTFPPPGIQQPRRNPSKRPSKPAVNSGRGFIPTAEPPFRIREPIPEFSISHPDPSRKLIKSVVSSRRGLMPMGPPPPRIREPRISGPAAPVANLGPHAAEPVVQSPRNVRPPPLDYLRPTVHKTSSPNSLHQLQHNSPPQSSPCSFAEGVSPSAIPKIVPPSSSPRSSDSQEKGKRTNVETFAVVRDRKVLITEGASLYRLCRSWLRNGLPEEENYQLPHEVCRITLPKPLPREKHSEDETRIENENKNVNEEVSFDHLTTEDLLKELINRGKKIRTRLREERRQRISRYKHRLSIIIALSNSDKT